MINDFLARLDNNPQPPGDIIWPEFEPAEVSDEEAVLRRVVLGESPRRRLRFLRAVQLTYLVAQSPLAGAITQNDPRVTYSPEGLRQLFVASGFVVQGPSGPNVAKAVVGTTPDTPDVGHWRVTVDSSTSGMVTFSLRDDLGTTSTMTVSYDPGGVSGFVLLPLNAGRLQFFNAGFDTNQTWEISYQAKISPWGVEASKRLETLKPDPTGVLSPRLLRAWRVAPLALDRLAAVVAGLGGAV